MPNPANDRTVVVSRYSGLADLAAGMGLVSEGAQVVHPATGEDVRGLHVICDTIDLSVAVYAASVTVIPLAIPCELDTPSAPSAVLRAFAAPPQSYVVGGASRVSMEVFDGGDTPCATEIAHRICALVPGANEFLDEIASLVDQHLAMERRAGAEAERTLLRALNNEQERRVRAEATRLGCQVGASGGVCPLRPAEARPLKA